MTLLSFVLPPSVRRIGVSTQTLLAALCYLLVLNSNSAEAQSTSGFRSTPASLAESKTATTTQEDATSQVHKNRRVAANNGSEAEWTAAADAAKHSPQTDACDDYRTSLESIREEKRKRLEAIHRRLQALLDNQAASGSEVFQPRFNQNAPSDQTTDSTDESSTSGQSAAGNSTKTQEATDPVDNAPPSQAESPEPPIITLPQPTVPLTVPPITPSPQSTQGDSTQNATTATTDSANPDRPFADMVDALTDTRPVVEAVPEEEESAPQPLTATTVLNSPVDRLKLADSLFASGEHALALQMYDAIDRSKISPNDRIWLKYQQASCYRRMGQIAEAESIYRQIAGESDAEWLAETSRWWLDRLSDRKELGDELRQIQDVLDTFEEAKKDADNANQ